jgi:hypothetical protein
LQRYFIESDLTKKQFIKITTVDECLNFIVVRFIVLVVRLIVLGVQLVVLLLRSVVFGVRMIVLPVRFIVLGVRMTILVVRTMNLNLILTGMGDFMVFSKNDLFEYSCFYDAKFVQKEEFSLNLMVLKKTVTIF